MGLDIKSHQTGAPHPFPVLVQGNEAQDQGCSSARSMPLPADVKYPSGDLFAWFSVDGRMVTSPIRVHVRESLRKESLQSWASRPVQGFLPRRAAEIFQPSLDPALYTRCVFTSRWMRWSLPSDTFPLDLSAMAYRCQRAIGGSWTEQLHSHADAATLAGQWSQQEQWPSPRTCPLCREGPGTPRHVVMACPAMAPLVDILRDDVEAELQAIQPLPALQAAAHTWRQRLHSTAPTSLPPPCSDGAAVRWPVLSAWRWLVPLPGWEANLSTDVAGSSRVATNRERGSDLAYRGVIPRFLGVSLCNLSPHEADSLRQAELELYATLRQPGALQHELQLLSKSRTAILPAVRLTQCLLLGLRKLRQAYQARTTTWLALCRAALPAADGDMPGEGQVVDRPPLRNSSSSLTAWLQSDAGQRLIRELRWALLRPEAAAARLRSMHPCGRLSDSTIISLLLQHGGAIISETLPSWAPELPSWSEASSALAVPCTCVPVLPAPLACCWTCGGVRLPELPFVPLPCIWCKQSGPAACVSCNITVHPRGSCRWWCTSGLPQLLPSAPAVPGLLVHLGTPSRR